MFAFCRNAQRGAEPRTLGRFGSGASENQV
jgi:hypothetical protein